MTATELLHEINKLKELHESLKNEISILLNDINNKELLLNKKLKELDSIESNYVDYIKKLNNGKKTPTNK